MVACSRRRPPGRPLAAATRGAPHRCAALRCRILPVPRMGSACGRQAPCASSQLSTHSIAHAHTARVRRRLPLLLAGRYLERGLHWNRRSPLHAAWRTLDSRYLQPLFGGRPAAAAAGEGGGGGGAAGYESPPPSPERRTMVAVLGPQLERWAERTSQQAAAQQAAQQAQQQQVQAAWTSAALASSLGARDGARWRAAAAAPHDAEAAYLALGGSLEEREEGEAAYLALGGGLEEREEEEGAGGATQSVGGPPVPLAGPGRAAAGH